jgi:flavin-dependent dehydrogenase
VTIAASVRLEEAGDRCWDVVVIGAGPAGAMAARQLARLGKSVLLIDKVNFPRWKVCGSCLSPGALATLRATGLSHLAACCGAVPLSNIELASWKYRASLPLTGGVALSRDTFDAALVGAAMESGAFFMPGTVAALGDDFGAARRVILRQGAPENGTGFARERRQEVNTRLVLAAVGLRGLGLTTENRFTATVEPGSRIGAGAVADEAPGFYRAGTVYMACGRGGYLGLVRREDGRLNLAAAFDPGFVQEFGGLGSAAVLMLGEIGWPSIDLLSELAWRGTPRLTRQAARLAGTRVLLLGDAANYVEPFTGEGMAWALAGGEAVAPLAARAAACWRPEVAKEWSALHASLITRRQRLCHLTARVLRRPPLVRMLIRALAHAPGLAKPLLRHLEQG